MVLAVYDFDRFGKHDIIGKIEVPMNSIDLGQIYEATKELEAADKVSFSMFLVFIIKMRWKMMLHTRHNTTFSWLNPFKMLLRTVKNSVISAFLSDTFQPVASSVLLFWKQRIWRKWTHVVCLIHMLKLIWWWTESVLKRKRLRSRRIHYRRTITNHSGKIFCPSIPT